MKLKNGQLFWGFFFFTIGVLFLLEKKDFIILDFEGLWGYWPILLILAGLSIIFKGTFVKPIVATISGVLLGLFIFSSFAFLYNSVGFSNDDFGESLYKYNTFSEEFTDSSEKATLKLDTGIGKVNFEGSTDKLLEGYYSGFFNSYDLNTTRKFGRTVVKLNYEPRNLKFFKKGNKNILNISLNEIPIWDLKLEFGAAKADIDLSNYKIDNFSLHTGASSTKLKFGDRYDKIDAHIEMGAASLKIYIPYNSGCKIESDMILITKDFEGFSKIGDGRYVSDNFDSSANKIYIKFDGGVSSLKILRY